MSSQQNSWRRLNQDFSAKDKLKHSQTRTQSSNPSPLNRREFFTRVSGATAVAGAVGLPSLLGKKSAAAETAKIVPANPQPRNVQAHPPRNGAAQVEF